jgi:aminoglycoside phosphotransferase (APT) family kinase protein
VADRWAWQGVCGVRPGATALSSSVSEHFCVDSGRSRGDAPGGSGRGCRFRRCTPSTATASGWTGWTVHHGDRAGRATRSRRALRRALADLHRHLDATAVDGSAGAALVHGDLHPGNVVMSAAGPVIIDWTDHRIGPRSLDLAPTWLVLACFRPDDEKLQVRLAPTRAPLLNGFLARSTREVRRLR